MRRALLLLSCLTCFVSTSFGQTVTETVNFDSYQSPTNNDFTNKFILAPRSYSSGSPTQVSTGGISGGALVPTNAPTILVPINALTPTDYAQYCSTYKNTAGVSEVTSLCFKYNSRLINSNYREATTVSIRLRNGNEKITFSLTHYLRLGLLIEAENFIQLVNPLTSLVTGHWYKTTATYTSFGRTPYDETFYESYLVRFELFDLGTTGTNTPVSVSLNETILYRDETPEPPSYTAEISGARWGGAELLDNFSYSGVKAGSLCSTLATQPISSPPAVTLFPNPASGVVTLDFGNSLMGQVQQVDLFDLVGRSCKVSQNWAEGKKRLTLDISTLKPGLYTINIQSSKGNYSKKLLIN